MPYRSQIFVVVLFLLLFVLNQFALGEQAVAPEVIDPFSTARLLKTIAALVFVCSLAVVVLKFLGPRLKSDKLMAISGKKLRVIDRLPLDRDNQLLLVAVNEEEELLISSGKTGTRLLATRNKDVRCANNE